MTEQFASAPLGQCWLVEQARKYRIDVALICLIPRHDRFSGHGSLFAKQALEAQGVRVIEVWSDMVDQRDWDRDAVVGRITGRCSPRCCARRVLT